MLLAASRRELLFSFRPSFCLLYKCVYFRVFLSSMLYVPGAEADGCSTINTGDDTNRTLHDEGRQSAREKLDDIGDVTGTGLNKKK